MSLQQTIVDSSPPNLEWRSADSSTRVSMQGGLADRIAGYVTQAYKSIPRRGAESGGLLLGGVRLGPVIDIFITGFQPIPCDHLSGPSFTVSDAVQSQFRTAIDRYPAAEILGFYRSHTRKGPGVDSSDQEIVDRIFPGLSGLVLLIKPTGVMTLNATYYFFQSGRLQTQPVGPEFPFLVSVPGGTPPPELAEEVQHRTLDPGFKALLQESLDLMPHPDDATAEPPAEPPHIAAPAAVPVAALPPTHQQPDTIQRRKRLQWEIVAAGLMTAAALALLWWQYRGASGEEAVATQSAPSHVAALGLAVQPGDGGWRISWDPKTSAAQYCVRGALNITEDESRERIPLTPSQVKAGFATYRPVGDDITFRLDLTARDNSLSTETYRVLQKAREPKAASRQPGKSVPAPAKTAAKAEKAGAKPGSKPEEPAESSGSYVESEVASRVAPEVPEGIRPRITAPLSIDVRVSIDPEGKVTKATAVQHEDGLVDYLGKRAVAAAKRWTFTPAKRGGKAVESSRTIHFVFEQ